MKKLEELNIKTMDKILYFILGFLVMGGIWMIWALNWKPTITIGLGG